MPCQVAVTFLQSDIVMSQLVMLQRSKAAQDAWLDVLRHHCADLEIGLAQEHQHRVRQEREKVWPFNNA